MEIVLMLKINCTKFYVKTSNGFKFLEVKYFSKCIIPTNGKLADSRTS